MFPFTQKIVLTVGQLKTDSIRETAELVATEAKASAKLDEKAAANAVRAWSTTIDAGPGNRAMLIEIDKLDPTTKFLLVRMVQE